MDTTRCLKAEFSKKLIGLTFYWWFLQESATESPKLVSVDHRKKFANFAKKSMFFSVGKHASRILKVKFVKQVDLTESGKVCTVLLQRQQCCFVFATYTNFKFFGTNRTVFSAKMDSNRCLRAKIAEKNLFDSFWRFLH